MNKWTKLIGNGDLKTHVAPGHLAEEIAADLTERGLSCSDGGGADNFFFDGVSGMVFMDRPTISTDICGLKAVIVCENIQHTIARLKSAPIRTTASGNEYVKYHDLYWCLVLTPAQRDEFVTAMSQRVAEADVLSCEFYANKKPINEILAEANAAAIGKPVAAEEVGIDPHKRYRAPKGVN